VIYVVAFCILGMAGFGVLWLSTLRQLHKTETERDLDWDMCCQAGLITAASIAEEKESP